MILLLALLLLLPVKGELAMRICTLFPLVSKLCSISILLTLLAALTLPQAARGQGLEVGGGWSHVTGDSGTDGFNVGAAWWFTKRVTIAADYTPPGIRPHSRISPSLKSGQLRPRATSRALSLGRESFSPPVGRTST